MKVTKGYLNLSWLERNGTPEMFIKIGESVNSQVTGIYAYACILIACSSTS